MECSPPDNSVDAPLLALYQAYLATLPEKEREIELEWNAFREHGAPEHLTRLHMAAHRLAGSGMTYGFQALSASAHELEATLADVMEHASPLHRDNINALQERIDILRRHLLHPTMTQRPDAQIRAPSIWTLPRGDQDGEPIRVLVVDDDPDMVQCITSWLAGHGYNVENASSGEEAVMLLDERSFDLLFLDSLMPGMSGLQVLEYVKDIRPNIDVVLTTAHGSEEIAVSAMRRGTDDYLRKPIAWGDFRMTLERSVNRLSLRRRNAALQRQLDEKHRQLEVELARAARVQMDLLPHQAPPLDGYQLAARCIPAREVGGDFYDWGIPAPGLLNLTFGDVMGKGVPAALLMSMVRAVFRAVARQTPPLTNMHYAMLALEPDMDRAGSFVTLLHAQLDMHSHRLTYVDAGHGLGMIRRANETIEILPSRGVPLGVPLTEAHTEGIVTFEPGDALILFSDGLLEPWPRLANDMVGAVGDLLIGVTSADAIVERLLALPALVGPCPDDLTVLALMRD